MTAGLTPDRAHRVLTSITVSYGAMLRDVSRRGSPRAVSQQIQSMACGYAEGSNSMCSSVRPRSRNVGS